MARDHVVISYGPPPTREQRNAYSNNARNRIAKNNRLRAQFQILKERGLLDFSEKYQARQRRQEELARFHAERMRRIVEMRRQRRQEQERASRNSNEGQKPEKVDNELSLASTQETNAHIAKHTLNHDP